VASFFDANLSASGDTEREAVSNLKDMIVLSLEMFEKLSDEQLGPGPARQKVVLADFVRRR